MAELQIRNLELRELKISPFNVRTNIGDISELRDSIRSLSEATRSLPDAIAERLRGIPPRGEASP